MSEKNSRDGSTRRLSLRKLLYDSALPPHYLDLLEEKRKQLDESIHKYIAAKEREYKAFEKDLVQQHKQAQGQDSTSNLVKRSAPTDAPLGNQDGCQIEWLGSQKIPASNASLLKSSERGPDGQGLDGDDETLGQQDRSTIAGLKDRRTSIERDKDFVGLFTPTYLPALDHRDDRKLERTSSAPSTVQDSIRSDGPGDAETFKRAKSDSAMQANPKRPSHLTLTQRNSSSGSSADGKLASAMKSPTQRSKQKRVSLALGDSIVAPSDSVPLSLSQNTTPSHSRIRTYVLERVHHTSAEGSLKPTVDEESSTEPSLQIVEPITITGPVNGVDSELQETVVAADTVQSIGPTSSSVSGARPSKIDPDGDLFGLEEEESDPTGGEAEVDGFDSDVLESDDDIVDDIDGTVGSEIVELETTRERYQSTTGIIPEPEDGTDSAVPYLASGPSSAGASQQPTRPGFRRPSVVHDPISPGANYKAAEQDAVENDIYGSSFNRLPSKGSWTVGSLGESYMAQHAEDMMKARSARQQAQVPS